MERSIKESGRFHGRYIVPNHIGERHHRGNRRTSGRGKFRGVANTAIHGGELPDGLNGRWNNDKRARIGRGDTERFNRESMKQLLIDRKITSKWKNLAKEQHHFVLREFSLTGSVEAVQEKCCTDGRGPAIDNLENVQE